LGREAESRPSTRLGEPPRGGVVLYKCYRKNPDGGVAWECYAGGVECNGNRPLTALSSGASAFERLGELELIFTALDHHRRADYG